MGPCSSRAISSEKPITAFSGVRSSWLTMRRNERVSASGLRRRRRAEASASGSEGEGSDRKFGSARATGIRFT